MESLTIHIFEVDNPEVIDEESEDSALSSPSLASYAYEYQIFSGIVTNDVDPVEQLDGGLCTGTLASAVDMATAAAKVLIAKEVASQDDVHARLSSGRDSARYDSLGNPRGFSAILAVIAVAFVGSSLLGLALLLAVPQSYCSEGGTCELMSSYEYAYEDINR